MLPFIPALLLVANTAVELKASIEQRDLLVGEPLKITVTWRSPGGGDVFVEDRHFSMHSLALEILGEGGSTLYLESLRGGMSEYRPSTHLNPGEEVAADLVFVMGFSLAAADIGRPARVLFPRPGEYSVRAVYLTDHQRPTGDVSNWLYFTVRAPIGSEKAVWDWLQGRPEILKGGWSREDWLLARPVLRRYPGSRYLRFAWFHHFDRVVNSLVNDLDPDSGRSFWPIDDEGRRKLGRDHFDRMLDEILAISDWGPFAPEALSVAIKFATHADKHDLSEQLTKELVTKYPDSLIAKRYRRGRVTPP